MKAMAARGVRSSSPAAISAHLERTARSSEPASAGREAGQTQADVRPVVEARLAEPLLQRSRRLGEPIGQRVGDSAKLGRVALDQLGDVTHGCL